MRIPRPRYRLYLSKNVFNIILAKTLTFKVFSGNYVNKFEKEIEKYIGCRHAIANSMARTSLYLLLKAYNLKKGSEVIVSTYTIPEVINIIIQAGCKPVFVDIDLNTYNMDPNLIEKKITKKTKVILHTHLFGQPDDIDKINKIAKKYNLITFEDCAQSFGARYNGRKVGNNCDAGYFSLGSYKNATTFYGGIITTDNDEIAKKIREMIYKMPYPKLTFLYKRIIRDAILWISTMKFSFIFTYLIVGMINKFDEGFIDRFLSAKHILRKEIPKNYLVKYTNIQAAIGLEQLKRIDFRNKRRKENADFYNRTLKDIKEIKIPEIISKAESIYFNYPIRVKNKKKILNALLKAGIDTTSGNITVCSEMDIYKEYFSECPVAKKAVREIMYLPIQLQLNKKQLQYIVDKLKGIFN